MITIVCPQIHLHRLPQHTKQVSLNKKGYIIMNGLNDMIFHNVNVYFSYFSETTPLRKTLLNSISYILISITVIMFIAILLSCIAAYHHKKKTNRYIVTYWYLQTIYLSIHFKCSSSLNSSLHFNQRYKNRNDAIIFFPPNN